MNNVRNGGSLRGRITAYLYAEGPQKFVAIRAHCRDWKNDNYVMAQLNALVSFGIVRTSGADGAPVYSIADEPMPSPHYGSARSKLGPAEERRAQDIIAVLRESGPLPREELRRRVCAASLSQFGAVLNHLAKSDVIASAGNSGVIRLVGDQRRAPSGAGSVHATRMVRPVEAGYGWDASL